MNGYAVKIKIISVIDGHTIVVRAVANGAGIVKAYKTTRIWCPVGSAVQLRLIKPGARAHIRFADYDAPERREPGGPEATAALRAAIEANTKDCWLFVESPKDRDGNDILDVPEMLKQWVSFNRIVGRILVGDADEGCRDIVDVVKARGG